MRLNDALSGLLLFLLGVVLVVYAWTFPVGPNQSIGPGLFPLIIGVGMSGCGVVLFWSGRKRPQTRWLEFEDWLRQPRMAVNALLVIGALIFYAMMVDTMGFFITAFTLLVVLFLAFGVDRRWIAPIAAGTTLGLHVAFYSFLRVPLPWGWLEGMAW